jgi:hypothetical protein
MKNELDELFHGKEVTSDENPFEHVSTDYIKEGNNRYYSFNLVKDDLKGMSSASDGKVLSLVNDNKLAWVDGFDFSEQTTLDLLESTLPDTPSDLKIRALNPPLNIFELVEYFPVFYYKDGVEYNTTIGNAFIGGPNLKAHKKDFPAGGREGLVAIVGNIYDHNLYISLSGSWHEFEGVPDNPLSIKLFEELRKIKPGTWPVLSYADIDYADNVKSYIYDENKVAFTPKN